MMIKNWLNWFYQRATGRNIGFLLVVEAVFELVVWPAALPKIAIGKMGVLDTLGRPFSVEEAYNSLSSYGPTGRHMYLLTELFIDPLYIICYGSLGIFLACFLVKKLVESYSMGWYVPILLLTPPIADVLEDVGFIKLLIAYPGRADFWATWSNLFSLLKWGFLLIGVGIIALSSLGVVLYAAKKRVLRNAR